MTNDEIANLLPNEVIEFPNGLQATVQQVDGSNKMITFDYVNTPEYPNPVKVICAWIELSTCSESMRYKAKVITPADAVTYNGENLVEVHTICPEARRRRI